MNRSIFNASGIVHTQSERILFFYVDFSSFYLYNCSILLEQLNKFGSVTIWLAVREWSSIMRMGTKREGEASEVLPLQKGGAEKV